MEKVKIFHNPRCSKSRKALELIAEKGPEIIEYLKNPPTENELKEIIRMLGIKPEELVRKGEELYKENYKNKKMSDADWIKAMTQNPILIERPIVIKGKKAVIARPPEKAKEI